LQVTIAKKLPAWRERVPRWLPVGVCSLFLFLLNALLCRELFTAEFTVRMESIEASYMAFSHWIGNHWSSLGWFPLWYGGMPWVQVYQPGFHIVVASLSAMLAWTTQHAYHFLAACEYCLGPATLFLLCFEATRRIGYSLTAGLIYSLISPASLLVPAIRADTEHLITGRRLMVLTRYGEGPHTTALLMIPLVLLCLHYAVTNRRRWAVGLAPLALAAVALTNWPGTIGLAMGIAAYLLSRLGSERKVRWLASLAIAAIAYAIASPWIPPSAIWLVPRNAGFSDGTILGYRQFGSLLGLLVILARLHFLFARRHVTAWFRFFVYFTIITGMILICRYGFGLNLLSQAHRFQLEFEMAFAGLTAWIAGSVYDRSPKRFRIVLASVLIALCGYQAVFLRRLAKRETRPIDITRTIEYRMAEWFNDHMGGRRVFAPGNVSLWMNLFTETPQMVGCCDQGVPLEENRIASYTIYTGQNAGERDADISILWLKAYGVDAIGVSGPQSTEFFHPFWRPRKFEGVLPVLWREGDNAVYGLNRRSPSLTHVLEPGDLVREPPANGLMVEGLTRYVDAIEAPNAPRAGFQWLDTSRARVTAQISSGQLVSVQITYHPGWRATVAGRPQRTSSDALGLLVIHPECVGNCMIDLAWTPTAEAKWTKLAMVLGLLTLVAWVAFPALRRDPRP
jgi:hypothetical protein